MEELCKVEFIEKNYLSTFYLFHFSCDKIEETVPYSVRHVSNVYSY
jgi:hypothetical protein